MDPNALDVSGLVTRSRLIGADPALVVHGGGNTSTKGVEQDWRGRPRAVLRVKGSGTDLATITADGFPGLYQDELDALRERDAMSDEDMVAYLAHCMREPGGRAPSIETLLHAWVPATHVDHTHADAICALSNHPDGPRAIAEALGADVAVVPYIRPGFELSRQVAEVAEEARAVVLDHHGLVTWGDTHDASAGATFALDAAARAYLDARRPDAASPSSPDLGAADVRALLGALREALTIDGVAPVLHVDRGQRALADRPDVATVAATRSTPDHILRIGAQSLVVEHADDVPSAIAAFAAAYTDRFHRHAARLPAGTSMLSPLPRLVLVPGLGCVSTGATAAAARANAELGAHSHGVTATVLDVFGAVRWLSEADIVDFDYWPLELRKLRTGTARPPLSGRVVILDAGALTEPLGVLLADAGALIAPDSSTGLDRWGGIDAMVGHPAMFTAPTATTVHLRHPDDDAPASTATHTITVDIETSAHRLADVLVVLLADADTTSDVRLR